MCSSSRGVRSAVRRGPADERDDQQVIILVLLVILLLILEYGILLQNITQQTKQDDQQVMILVLRVILIYSVTSDACYW